jgi:hypothetical protein
MQPTPTPNQWRGQPDSRAWDKRGQISSSHQFSSSQLTIQGDKSRRAVNSKTHQEGGNYARLPGHDASWTGHYITQQSMLAASTQPANSTSQPHDSPWTTGLSSCNTFSKIDLVQAYHQIPVHPDGIQKTVINPDGEHTPYLHIKNYSNHTISFLHILSLCVDSWHEVYIS